MQIIVIGVFNGLETDFTTNPNKPTLYHKVRYQVNALFGEVINVKSGYATV